MVRVLLGGGKAFSAAKQWSKQPSIWIKHAICVRIFYQLYYILKLFSQQFSSLGWINGKYTCVVVCDLCVRVCRNRAWWKLVFINFFPKKDWLRRGGECVDVFSFFEVATRNLQYIISVLVFCLQFDVTWSTYEMMNLFVSLIRSSWLMSRIYWSDVVSPGCACMWQLGICLFDLFYMKIFMRNHSRCLYLLGFCMNVCVLCEWERVFSYCRALNFISKKQNKKITITKQRKTNKIFIENVLNAQMFISITIVR